MNACYFVSLDVVRNLSIGLLLLPFYAQHQHFYDFGMGDYNNDT